MHNNRLIVFTVIISLLLHLAFFLFEDTNHQAGIRHNPSTVSVSMKYREIGNTTLLENSKVVSNSAPKPKPIIKPKPKKKSEKVIAKKEPKLKEKPKPKIKRVVASKSKKSHFKTVNNDVLKKGKSPTKLKAPKKLAIEKKKEVKKSKVVAKIETKAKPVENIEEVTVAKVIPPKKANKPRYKLGSSANPRPSYPSLARKKGWGGEVILGVHVNEDGSIKELTFVKSTDYGILNYEAWETVKMEWSFKALSVKGVSGLEYIEVPFYFDPKK